MITTLTGPNAFLSRQALDVLIADFTQKFGIHGIERVSGEALEPNRLPELLQGASLFAAERLVVLCDAAQNKPLWDTLANWLERVPSETTLVIVEPNPDKRTKTYKQLQKLGEVRMFDELNEPQLVEWLQSVATQLDGKIDTNTAHYLVQQVGTEQWRLWHELHKLVQYQPLITKAAIEELVEPSPQASAFELLDACLAREVKTVERLLAALATREDPYRFFGLLVSQVHAMAVVKMAGSKSAAVVAQEAGIHPFVVRKTQGLVRTMSPAELRTLVTHVALCDEQLKSTGANPWLLLGQCLGKIASR